MMGATRTMSEHLIKLLGDILGIPCETLESKYINEWLGGSSRISGATLVAVGEGSYYKNDE